MFASSLSKNQIISFLLAMAFCYFFYESFKRLSELQIFGKNGFIIEWLGIDYHYFSVSRGVIDSRDLLYFFGFVAIFLGCTKWRFSSRLW
jgi:ABC-2 type transport system permease protein